jgi:transglutaminase-like putative cysteine protease
MALGLSVALVVAGAIAPSVSVYRIVDFLRDLSQRQAAKEDGAELLGLEPQSQPASAQLSILDARRSAGLPTRHLIGSGPELSEQVVMEVTIESLRQDAEQPDAPADATEDPEPAYYWRGLTYDRYAELGWSTEYAGKARYAAGEAAISPSATGHRLLRQRVHLVDEQSGLLFAAGSLVTTDRKFQIAWRALPGEGEQGDAFGAMVDATRYRADSLVPVFGEADLRAAGQDYPAWVLERYLQLADTIPDRVLALARELTATESTAYDRALAIERYLRAFPYTVDLPAPPTGRDLVDYFLFDLRQGYCDYYASAMVVLARAAGLPARLVTGYASGSYDEAQHRYTITGDQAHAWPEIYFPGYGWIEFEPTPAQPAIERPAGAMVDAQPAPEMEPESITAYRVRLNWALWLGVLAGLLLLALASAFIWSVVDGWRLRRLAPDAAVIDLYQRLRRHGRWLGVLSRKGDTPREYASACVLRLAELMAGERWSKLLVFAEGEVAWLAELCTRSLYSPWPTEAAEQARAIQTWRRLRGRLWLARLSSFVPLARKINLEEARFR